MKRHFVDSLIDEVCKASRIRQLNILVCWTATVVTIAYGVYSCYSVSKTRLVDIACVCLSTPTSRLSWTSLIGYQFGKVFVSRQCHRAVSCRGPVYLRDLICIYTPSRSPRSAGTKLLTISKIGSGPLELTICSSTRIE